MDYIGRKEVILYTVAANKGESFEEGKVSKDQIAAFETSICFRKVSTEKHSALTYIFLK